MLGNFLRYAVPDFSRNPTPAPKGVPFTLNAGNFTPVTLLTARARMIVSLD